MRGLELHQAVLLKQTVKALLLMSIVFASVWKLTQWMGDPTTLPIKQVRVEGNLQFLSQADVAQAVGDSLSTGYFAIDKQQVIAKLAELSWVKSAQVSRVWPDTVVLTITEHVAYAHWNKNSLLSNQGVIFTPLKANQPQGLPQLTGVNAQSELVISEFKKTNVKLERDKAQLVVLNLANHGSWKGVLSNGTQLEVGQHNPSARIAKGVHVLATLSENILEQVEAIDLRYPNGISVSWKEGFSPNPKKTGIDAFAIQQVKLIKG